MNKSQQVDPLPQGFLLAGEQLIVLHACRNSAGCQGML